MPRECRKGFVLDSQQRIAFAAMESADAEFFTNIRARTDIGPGGLSIVEAKVMSLIQRRDALQATINRMAEQHAERARRLRRIESIVREPW